MSIEQDAGLSTPSYGFRVEVLAAIARGRITLSGDRELRTFGGQVEHGEGGASSSGDSGPRPPRSRPRTVAEKLDRLFQVMSPKGRPYSYQQVADAINEKAPQTGVTISHATIWQLRTGRSTDPRLSHLQALADFFGVPVNYFTEDDVAAKVDDDLDLIAAMRDINVRTVAVRARGLSPEALRAVTTMIEAVRDMEGVQGSEDTSGEGAQPDA